jgi:hypothetical protein
VFVLRAHAARVPADDARQGGRCIGGLIDKHEGRFKVFEATDPCMPVEYPHQVFNRVNTDKRVVLHSQRRA